jgi:hypothetical protein
MIVPAVVPEIVKAVPVVVGGLLAIGGGVASQFLVHRLTEKREKANLRRERLEALVKAVYAHDQWLNDMRTRMVFHNEDHDSANPLDEARMLQALHFPELAAKLLAVQQAQIPLLTFINEQRLKHMKNKDTFVAEWDPKPFSEGYKNYLWTVHSLVEEARTLLAEK